MNTVSRGATQNDMELAMTKWLGGARDREGGGRQGCVPHRQQETQSETPVENDRPATPNVELAKNAVHCIFNLP